jgi:fucose 4-O-acetylase-like acetyltransferase
MQSKSRDLSLDVLKGLGCLLMIMAHLQIQTGFYKQLTFLGGFAPVPFYAVVGVTTLFQTQKYKPRSVLLNFLFLFLIGFALNGFNSPDFLRPPVIHLDIISIIAVGAIAVYLVEYYFKPSAWIYLVLGVLCFLIKLALDVLLPVKDYPLLAGLILPYSGTFPVIPWLFLFFLGVYVYRAGWKWNLFWMIFAMVVFVSLALIGFNLDYRSKFDMSLGYFLLSCVFLFALFLVFSKIKIFESPSALNPIVFFGQNSLLFLFVHFCFISLFELQLQRNGGLTVFNDHLFLRWLSIFAVTWIAMAALLYLAKINPLRSFFDRIWIWILLAILILTIPLIPNNEFVRYAEVVLGIIAALHYHQLSRALKGRRADVRENSSLVSA